MVGRRLKLTVNEGKTRICRVPEQSLQFLGYTIGRCWSTQTGRSYIGTRPSKKRMKALCEAISEMTSRRWYWEEAQDRVGRLNRLIGG